MVTLNQLLAKVTRTPDVPPASAPASTTSKSSWTQRIGAALASGNIRAAQEPGVQYCVYNGGKYVAEKKDDGSWFHVPEKGESGLFDKDGNGISWAQSYSKILKHVAPHKEVDENSTKTDVTNALIEANIEYIILHPEETIRLELYMSDQDAEECVELFKQRKDQYLKDHNYANDEEARNDLIAKGVDKVNKCSWPAAFYLR